MSSLCLLLVQHDDVKGRGSLGRGGQDMVGLKTVCTLLLRLAVYSDLTVFLLCCCVSASSV